MSNRLESKLSLDEIVQAYDEQTAAEQQAYESGFNGRHGRMKRENGEPESEAEHNANKNGASSVLQSITFVLFASLLAVKMLL